jgi:DNA-binding MarR family transcriptional regulator
MSNEIVEIDSIVENLISIVPIIAKTYSRAVRSKTDFTPGELFTLGALAHHEKLTMTGIGLHLSVPKPQVTALVDKLIKNEFAERLYDSNDRRIIYIQLTEKGREVFSKTKKIIGSEIKERIKLLEQEKLVTLQRSSREVRSILIEIMKDYVSLQHPNIK